MFKNVNRSEGCFFVCEAQHKLQTHRCICMLLPSLSPLLPSPTQLCWERHSFSPPKVAILFSWSWAFQDNVLHPTSDLTSLPLSWLLCEGGSMLLRRKFLLLWGTLAAYLGFLSGFLALLRQSKEASSVGKEWSPSFYAQIELTCKNEVSRLLTTHKCGILWSYLLLLIESLAPDLVLNKNDNVNGFHSNMGKVTTFMWSSLLCALAWPMPSMWQSTAIDGLSI